MNAIVQLPRLPSPTTRDDKSMSYAAPANDDRLREVGAIFGPEESLWVSFVGLTPAEQQRALASFPGARRCVVADA
jgi:hypothetical protein